MTGRVTVAGLGPGAEGQVTPEVSAAVARAEIVFGYEPYLRRLPLRADQERHASDNREELLRARAAIDAASAGREALVVSGGDPGVFAMAAAVCEALDADAKRAATIDLVVLPGITAMLAAAARVGAPLGHDFCAISLSDNLKPWSIVERRLRAAAEAGFVLALYNAVSRARPWQLAAAFDILRGVLPGPTPVVFARAIGRPDERVTIAPLADAASVPADMATCIIVGSPETRLVLRDGRAPLVYTPRRLSSA